MKNNIKNIYFCFLLLLGFAITGKVIHEYEHIVEQSSTKHCYHQYSKNKTQISHSHNEYDDCDLCLHFTSFFTSIFSFNLKAEIPFISQLITILDSEIVSQFQNFNFSLRGPPSFLI